MTLGVVHDIRRLQVILRNLTNNLIFQEAYDMTGRVLGITVCSPRKHEPPRCHNYLTSPHVVIWSAVTASCAFPGLFEAQELMAKDRSGEIVPYHPPFHWGPEETKSSSTRRWIDGSLKKSSSRVPTRVSWRQSHLRVELILVSSGPQWKVYRFCVIAHVLKLESSHRRAAFPYNNRNPFPKDVLLFPRLLIHHFCTNSFVRILILLAVCCI
ncbi:hypothetical protein L2E82_25830 [Cichorium intybus]|uniref:Uncharacterized protein n=1 Tax=Cichorium intybus TaxID=13427 RepID=A0ACB9E5B2_CICIN|nr:hypothetical protein L2E82_25830 [Cichorium intybus]